MRKLNPIQQEVIDLINQGWELGSDTTINGRCWMQKGGLGKGGESKNVSHSTVHVLEYLGYIERGERHFPILHYRLKVEKTTTDMQLVKEDSVTGDAYKHPSFATISFTRTQGGSQALFGSSIKHNNAILLRISHAEKHRSNANDHIFSRGVIVEAYLSPTQFADAIIGHGKVQSCFLVPNGVYYLLSKFVWGRICVIGGTTWLIHYLRLPQSLGWW